MDAESPRVVLLDDGELDDVRAALCELGVAHCDARRATMGERVPVLFSTPARALALADGRSAAPLHQLHAVIGRDGEEVAAPCDLALRRPIASSVLRLLARRPDHAARLERRLSTRVALATPVIVRVGDDRREVILTRISIGGCGLVSPALMRTGAHVAIELPPELSAPRRLALSGEVLGSRELATGDGITFDISVAFRALDLVDRVTLRALMARHAIDFRPASEELGPRRARLAPAGVAPDRRPSTVARRRFQQRVMGVSSGIAHVLLARDLSRDGLRVQSHDWLAVGDALQVAVFGGFETAPLLAPGVSSAATRSMGCSCASATRRLIGPRLDALIDSLAPVDLDP